MSANDSTKATKTGPTPKRDILYAEAAKHAPRAIEVLVEIMEHGDSDSNKMGAAKVILAKAIPDLHQQELTGKDGQQLTININRDYVSPRGWIVPASTHSAEGSNSVQGSNMAPQSQKDLDSPGEGSDGGSQRPQQNILDSIPNQDSSQRSDLEGSEHVVPDHPSESDRTPE